MNIVTQSKVEQFAKLAVADGWEWCGVQEAIPPALPGLVITKRNQTKFIPFDSNEFDPIKIATLYLAPTEKKMTDTPKLNLRQKLVQIYQEIDYIEKGGTNTKQNYKFVKAADVLRAIRNAFAKWGIYAETNYEPLGTYDIKTNSGGNMHTTSVRATIVLYDVESDETKIISGLGDGADPGDKGIYKAQTGATKNALRNGFLLPDEADPEADENVDSSVAGSIPEELPDFQDAQRGAPKPPAAPKAKKTAETAKPSPKAPQEAPALQNEPIQPPPPPIPAEKQNQEPAVAPEHGDAYEGPDDDRLPTEEELTTYRQNFTKLADSLTTEGKLKASKGLPVNRKLLVFLISITKAIDAKTITQNQWENFFKRVDAAKANAEVGLVGITKLVNKANGIEDKN